MMQEKLQQKIHYTGNAKYVKDTLKVLDNDNNIWLYTFNGGIE